MTIFQLNVLAATSFDQLIFLLKDSRNVTDASGPISFPLIVKNLTTIWEFTLTTQSSDKNAFYFYTHNTDERDWK